MEWYIYVYKRQSQISMLFYSLHYVTFVYYTKDAYPRADCITNSHLFLFKTVSKL